MRSILIILFALSTVSCSDSNSLATLKGNWYFCKSDTLYRYNEIHFTDSLFEYCAKPISSGVIFGYFVAKDTIYYQTNEREEQNFLTTILVPRKSKRFWFVAKELSDNEYLLRDMKDTLILKRLQGSVVTHFVLDSIKERGLRLTLVRLDYEKRSADSPCTQGNSN